MRAIALFSILSLVLVLLLIALPVSAVSIDSLAPPKGFVNDYVGVLASDEKAALESQVQQVNKSSTVEIAVAIVNSTDGQDIAQYATALGNKWKVGKSDVFNGVLILIAVDDRAYFIATAKGIEGTLPDIIVNRIGDTQFPPYFKQGDYYTGIFSAVYDLNAYIAKDPTIVSRYTSHSYVGGADGIMTDQEAIGTTVGFFGIFILIGLCALFATITNALKLGKKVGGVAGTLLSILLIIGGFYIGFLPWYMTLFMIFFVGMFGLAIAFGQWTSGGGSGGWYGGSGGFSGGGFSSGGGGSFGGGGGFSGGGGGGRW